MYEEKCSTDPLAFQILIGIGCVFTLSYFLVGLIINFFDTRKLLGELTAFHLASSEIVLINLNNFYDSRHMVNYLCNRWIPNLINERLLYNSTATVTVPWFR